MAILSCSQLSRVEHEEKKSTLDYRKVQLESHGLVLLVPDISVYPKPCFEGLCTQYKRVCKKGRKSVQPNS